MHPVQLSPPIRRKPKSPPCGADHWLHLSRLSRDAAGREHGGCGAEEDLSDCDCFSESRRASDFGWKAEIRSTTHRRGRTTNPTRSAILRTISTTVAGRDPLHGLGSHPNSRPIVWEAKSEVAGASDCIE